MSLGRSGPGVRSGFLETPRIHFGGVFLRPRRTRPSRPLPGLRRLASDAGRQYDVAGKQSPWSLPFSFTLDTTGPSVSSVDMTTGTLSAAAGGKISVTVKFPEAVRLGTTGSPATFPQYIDLPFGTVIRRATYESSDGTDTIVFSYTLVPADRAPTGVRLAGSINLGGSTLRDLVGNNATVTLRTPLNSLPIVTA